MTPPDLLRLLRTEFGHAGFRPGQEEIIGPLLQGQDVLGVMPTGAGKSLCFQLPALLLPGTTLVLSPLIALMKDQLESLPPVLRERATLLNMLAETSENEQRLRGIARGQYRL